MQDKKAVIYCRVSTKEQVEEGNSLVTQEKVCKDYALKNGYEIAGIFIEEGESAKTAKRTELRRLLDYCAIRKNGINAVIAYKIDRIARNIDDYRQIRLALKLKGVEIKSTSEFFEDTPAGRFMENIIANVAQFDNDVRTERSVGGMRGAIREGRFVWYAPIGYINTKIGGKATIGHSKMAPLVLKAFEEVAKNVTPIDEVRRQITEQGLVNRSGKPITGSYLYKMLRNELYAGWIVGLGERQKGLFEPIVSEELFEQVQRVLTYRTRKSTQYKRNNPDFPLRRFLFHPSGKRLTGCWSKGRNRKYPYYLYHINGLAFKKDDLETAFIDFFDQFRLNEKQYAKFRAMFKVHLLKATADKQKQVLKLQQYQKDLKQKQQYLIQKNLDGIISDAVLKEQLKSIDAEMLRIGATIPDLPNSKANLEHAFTVVSEYLKRPSTVWRQANLEGKLKLQWFNFPKGISFDGREFRTDGIASVFKDENGFAYANSSWVTPSFPSSNQILKYPYAATNSIAETVKLKTLTGINQELHWSRVEQEIIRLAGILKEISTINT